MEMEPKHVGLRDIAKVVGVSHVTVSLALRGHPRISEATRRRIHDVAEELGYRPDPMLAALASYKTKGKRRPITAELAWINGWRHPQDLRKHKEFDLCWNGAHAAAEKFGYRLEEFVIGKECSPLRLHQILKTRGIRGILLPPHQDPPDWQDFPWQEYSVVRFGRSLLVPQAHVVTANQTSNSILAFQMMRQRGYQRIGFVTDETSFKMRGHMFEAGYLAAQRLVSESERLTVFAANDHPASRRTKALSAWFKEMQPDAVLTNMPEAPAMFKSIGIRVPDDIGMAGTSIHDIALGAGIDQHAEVIGRTGFLLLNSLILDGTRGIPTILQQNLVEGSWVDGDSLPIKR